MVAHRVDDVLGHGRVGGDEERAVVEDGAEGVKHLDQIGHIVRCAPRVGTQVSAKHVCYRGRGLGTSSVTLSAARMGATAQGSATR